MKKIKEDLQFIYQALEEKCPGCGQIHTLNWFQRFMLWTMLRMGADREFLINEYRRIKYGH